MGKAISKAADQVSAEYIKASGGQFFPAQGGRSAVLDIIIAILQLCNRPASKLRKLARKASGPVWWLSPQGIWVRAMIGREINLADFRGDKSALCDAILQAAADSVPEEMEAVLTEIKAVDWTDPSRPLE